MNTPEGNFDDNSEFPKLSKSATTLYYVVPYVRHTCMICGGLTSSLSVCYGESLQ